MSNIKPSTNPNDEMNAPSSGEDSPDDGVPVDASGAPIGMIRPELRASLVPNLSDHINQPAYMSARGPATPKPQNPDAMNILSIDQETPNIFQAIR